MSFRFVAGVALAAAVALPASASAAGTINGGPVKVKGGYQLSVSAVDAKKDTFTVILVDADKHETEQHLFTFRKGVKVTVKGKSASIKGKLGRWGSVDLKLRNAKTDKKKPREGCSAAGRTTGTTRTGTLEGRLRFRMPNGKFVTVRKLRAQTYSGSVTSVDPLQCDDDRVGDGGEGGDGDGQNDEPQLFLTKDHADGKLSFIARKRSLMLTWSQEPKGKKQPAQITRTATATGENLLTASDGGVTAAVKGTKPFTGNGAYRADPAIPGPATTGTLLGSLKVTLPGVPVVSVAGDGAVLLNGDK
ncbi:MAG: hypothetical protein AB7G37_10220 [Solirubrobacteraceae bacterium]